MTQHLLLPGRSALLTCAFAWLLMPAAPARAQGNDDDLRQRLERLEKHNEQLERQNQELLRAVKELQQARTPAASSPTSPGPGEAGTADRGKASLQQLVDEALEKRDGQRKPGPQPSGEGGFTEVGGDLAMRASWQDGFVARSANDDFRIHLGGKVQQDWAAFRPDAHLNQAFPGQWDPGADFRSLRLRADGTCWEVVDFVLEMDFISNVATGAVPNFPTPTDVFMQVTQLPVVGNFRAGHFKEPFSLERYGTSETDITFMERSSAHDAFDPIRNVGLMLFDTELDQGMTWATGIFRTNSDNNSGNVFDYGNHELSSTSRVTFNPVYVGDGRCVLHLGGAYSWRGLDRDDTGNAIGQNPSRARFASRMPLRVGSPTLVDTGLLPANEYELFNLQALVILGPLSLQGEFYDAQVHHLQRGTTTTDPSFNGCYVEASYFLTGESRVYNRKVGGIGKVRPFENFWLVRDAEGGHSWGSGAWQVAVRYNYLDLTSRSLDALGPGLPAVATAGVLQTVDLGLNWYLNPNFKVQWNYSHTWRADANVVNGNGAVDGLGLRFNWDF